MKFLCKKIIFFISMLVVVVNMVSSAFAGTYEWTDGGVHIASVTASGNYITREYQLDAPVVFHPTNYQNSVTIPAGTSISCYAETNFPTAYETYLNQALINEGFLPVARYGTTNGEDVVIKSTQEEGFYVAVIVFEGRGGNWWIRGSENLETAPSLLLSGTYTFAPVDHYEIVRKVY